MAGYVEKGVIRLHEKVGHDIWRMQIELPQTAKSALPGQFIHIKINDPSKLLRRPISIAGIEPGKGLVEIIYRIVGNGTEAMAHMKIGDIVDSLGPLGTSFSMDKGHIVGVGGGVGIAPILFMARCAKRGQMTVVIGGRNKEEVFWKDLFPKTLKQLIVTTDDGSYERKGMVTEVIKDLVNNQGKKYDVCVAIGPMIMMKFVCLLTKELEIPTVVSLNPIMVDGTGMCGACRVTVDGKVKFACVDGPEFDGHAVNFDEAMKRQQMYKTEEGRALLKLREGDTHHGGCGNCSE